ncbi:hypothetical protein MMC13_005144 [Lambiella insularis]|nr:hypothetical protein [Lambiella insularis]
MFHVYHGNPNDPGYGDYLGRVRDDYDNIDVRHAAIRAFNPDLHHGYTERERAFPECPDAIILVYNGRRATVHFPSSWIRGGQINVLNIHRKVNLSFHISDRDWRRLGLSYKGTLLRDIGARLCDLGIKNNSKIDVTTERRGEGGGGGRPRGGMHGGRMRGGRMDRGGGRGMNRGGMRRGGGGGMDRGGMDGEDTGEEHMGEEDMGEEDMARGEMGGLPNPRSRRSRF